MFDRDRFDLMNPTGEACMYMYVTKDTPDDIEGPDYFKRLRSDSNVRENDIVRVISDQGASKFHAEFCFMQIRPNIRHVIIGTWQRSKLDIEDEERPENIVDLLVEAFKETPEEHLISQTGLPDKRRYVNKFKFTQDEWEMAVSVFGAWKEAQHGVESESEAAVNG